MQDERGFALVIALAVTVVFSMTIITVIEAATSNAHSSDNSKNRVSAYALAEAGIADANALLSWPNATDPSSFISSSRMSALARSSSAAANRATLPSSDEKIKTTRTRTP